MELTFREWRRVREMSQEDLARKLGVHANTVAHWEDRPWIIPIEKAKLIATILDVPIDQIIFSQNGLQNVDGQEPGRNEKT